MSNPIALLITGLWGFALASPSQDDGILTREIILARFERLHNLVADYRITTKYTPAIPPEEIVRKDAEGNLHIMSTGTRVTRKQFFVLRDRCMYVTNDRSWDREFDHPDIARIAALQKSTYVRTPERAERFHGNDRGARNYMGEISNYAPLPDSGEFEVGLGLRMWGAPDPLTPTDIESMTLTRTDEGKISLRGPNHEGRPNEWLFDPQFGYAPVRYRVYKRENDEVGIEYTMEDFRPVDGLMLPFRVRGVWGMDPNDRSRTETVVVTAYRLDDPTNTPERYHIDWPEGTRIKDTRSGVKFRVKGDALQYIADERIAQIALDQLAEGEVKEPNVAEYPEPPSPAREENSVELKGPNAPADSGPAGHGPWLGAAPVLLFAGVLAGVLCLRCARERP
jgi:hypothetical protein